MTEAPFRHEPAEQDCTICHRPHTSDYDQQLVGPVEQLCVSCHADIDKQIKGATTPHAAVFTAQSCANCHDPHATGRPVLLRDRLDRLCLSCHDEPLETEDGHVIPDMRPTLTERKYLHGPVKSGDCAACHNVHGATHTRLLRQSFPPTFYASFDLTSYALCFQCHNRELVMTASTTALTDFRDGAANLHYLHVNRQKKGRTCRTCHAIHGSDLPKHMATNVPFEGSQWAMPIGFAKTADGGSCAPGCHEARSYSRAKTSSPPAATPIGGTP